jgi:hypothetical protein
VAKHSDRFALYESETGNAGEWCVSLLLRVDSNSDSDSDPDPAPDSDDGGGEPNGKEEDDPDL